MEFHGVPWNSIEFHEIEEAYLLAQEEDPLLGQDGDLLGHEEDLLLGPKNIFFFAKKENLFGQRKTTCPWPKRRFSLFGPKEDLLHGQEKYLP